MLLLHEIYETVAFHTSSCVSRFSARYTFPNPPAHRQLPQICRTDRRADLSPNWRLTTPVPIFLSRLYFLDTNWVGPGSQGSWSGPGGDRLQWLRLPLTGVGCAGARLGFCGEGVEGWAAGEGDQGFGTGEVGSAEAFCCWLPKQSQHMPVSPDATDQLTES